MYNSKVMDELIASDTVFNEDISGQFVDNQNYFKALADNAKQINFKDLITPYDSALGYQRRSSVSMCR